LDLAENLTRIVLTEDDDLPSPVPLPAIGVKILDGKRVSKYGVTNGQHRIARAAELGMTHISAYVMEAH